MTTEIGPLRDGYRECGNGHVFETEIVNLPLREVSDLYWIVKKWAKDNAFDINNLVDVEKRLNGVIQYPDGEGGWVKRVLTGQLDALLVEGLEDEHAIVIDWKDTWGMPGPTEVSFEGYFQQRFYAWLVMVNYPTIQQVTLREFYVRYSEPREATLTRTAFEDVQMELSALVERFDRSVHNGEYVPTPGKHCSYCPRPTLCPIPKHVRGAGKIENAEDAEKAARRLVVARSIIGQETDALAGWATLNGPIPMRDAKGYRVMGHRPIKTTVRPTREQLLEAAREAGSLDAVDLDALYVERAGTRFEPHVPKPERETDEDADMIEQLKAAVDEAQARRKNAA
jgi:hypothetical protein